MTVAEALTAIRSVTRFDTVTPSPVTNAQITVWLDQELKRLRRQLNVSVPQLFVTTTSNTVVASGSQTIAKAADFERLIRLERLVSGDFYATVEPSDRTNPSLQGFVGFEEQVGNFWLEPKALAAGTYRIVYNPTVTAGYTTLEVPDGLEDVIIERVAARIKERLAPEDAAGHFAVADRILAEQLPLLKLRFGRNNMAGFKAGYRRTP